MVSQLIILVLVVFAGTVALVSLALCTFHTKNIVEQERVDMGVLKALGYTGSMISRAMMAPYTVVCAAASLLGLALSFASMLGSLVSMQSGFTYEPTVGIRAFGITLIVLVTVTLLFAWIGVHSVRALQPIDAIRGCAQSARRAMLALQDAPTAITLQQVGASASRNMLVGAIAMLMTLLISFSATLVYNSAVSVDALLGVAATSNGNSGEYRYEDVTNYDIGQTKHFDIDCGSIYSCMIRGYDGEQLRVRVVSDTVAEIARHFKVSIDDRPKRLDVTVNRGAGISETLAKDDVSVILWVPQRYITTMECAAKTFEAHVRGLACDGVELDVRTQRLTLDGVHAHVEIDCNLDMDITCVTLDGRVDVNQLSATSHITVPRDAPVAVQTRGLRTRTIIGPGVRVDEDSKNIIELNGVGSELIIEGR